jgi:three-Cys-motif partner protein
MREFSSPIPGFRKSLVERFRMGIEGEHRFGGDWTEEKLQHVSSYMDAYFNVMKNQKFSLAYVDCFAGSGYRTTSDDAEDIEDHETSDAFKDGSARIALKKTPGFDQFYFVEKDPSRFADLRKTLDEFPSKRITISKNDANDFISEFCAQSWRSTRAVMFLDPYGMQVDWSSLETIAKTGAVDLWILIPIGIGPNRLLVKDGTISQSWEDKLSRFFGCSKESWYEDLYPKTGQMGLFEDEPEERKKLSLNGIANYIRGRLESIFEHVAPNPRPIGPPKNPEMYYLFFAASNEKGGKIAVRIADHLLTR